MFRTFTWPHLPETCLQCRWSSRCIRQLCSWCYSRLVCIQPGSLAAGGRWSTWLCLSETGWQQLRTHSSPQLCRHTPHTWSPKTGSWCETSKQKGTRHRRSATEEIKTISKLSNWHLNVRELMEKDDCWLTTISVKGIMTPPSSW